MMAIAILTAIADGAKESAGSAALELYRTLPADGKIWCINLTIDGSTS